MLQSCNGKLLVYASSYTSYETRLKSVNTATERIARLLKLEVETIMFRKRFASIYVYYDNGEQEPIPIYCDKGEKSDAQAVWAAIRNMMFVLSFHPEHSGLKPIRRAAIQPS
jgi:hypothetical protein